MSGWPFSVNASEPTRRIFRRCPVDVDISSTWLLAMTFSAAGTRYSSLTAKYGSGGNDARCASGTGDSGDRRMNWSFSACQAPISSA